MPPSIAPQADVGTIPSNSLSVLGSLQPLLKALTADNVNPLAVLQVQAIGSCFHLNGDFASKVPELLVRSKSLRLERISQWVGWHAGDTASSMAQTAGGRAASVLSLSLVEAYGIDLSGQILCELSKRILPADQNHTGLQQLGDVAGILSNKLAAVGYGSHFALHVTRIREVYFNSGLVIPTTLLDRFTVETMVEFLCALRTALQEENSVLYFEGCEGAGQVVALVMALCPDDALVLVEHEVIFQGGRGNVTISISAGSRASSSSLESRIRGSKKRSNSHNFVHLDPASGPYKWNTHLKWKGCFVDTLDLAFLAVGARRPRVVK